DLGVLRGGTLPRKVDRPRTVEFPLFAVRLAGMTRVIVVIDRISVKREHQKLNWNSVTGTAVAEFFRKGAAIQVPRESAIVLGPIELEVATCHFQPGCVP